MSPYLEHAAQLEQELLEVKDENTELRQKIEEMSGRMHRHLESINELQGIEKQRDDMQRQLTDALDNNTKLYTDNKRLREECQRLHEELEIRSMS